MPRRVARFVNIRTAADGSNGALAETCGPSRTISKTNIPATRLSPDDTRITDRHDPSDNAAKRYGNALPSVRLPTRTPSAVPLLALNQPATSFMPVGYTSASALPVAKRQATASTGDGAVAVIAFARAAAMQPAANTQRALTRSARLSIALTSVPATNPPCTAMVSHAAWALSR